MQQGQKFSNIFRISFMSNLETIIEALEKLVVIDGKCSRINRKLVYSVAVYLFLELICHWFEKKSECFVVQEFFCFYRSQNTLNKHSGHPNIVGI